MSVKSELKKIEDRLIGDPRVIIVSEQLSKRGFFKVQDHEDDGLLTREEVLEKFDADDVNLIFLVYEDNWRGGEDEREK